MKINWGTGIVIAITCFAIFIGYFFVRGLQNPSELVSENYYDSEVRYQQHIDNRSRAKSLGNIYLKPVNNKVAIVFPKAFTGALAQGEIHFYKPNDAKSDVRIALNISNNNEQLIDVATFSKGLWYIKIDATLGGNGYYWEESIHL